MTTLLERRRAIMKRGSSINWESIARGMCDTVTSFELPAEVNIHCETANICIGRSGLTSVVLPSDKTTIGKSAFSSCGNLVEVTLNEGLTTIGEAAFQNCTKLPSITIPSTVTSVGVNFMRQCAALQEVVMLPTTPPTIGVNSFLQSYNLTSIYVPDASVSSYKGASGWSSFADKIKPISERP